MIGARLAPHRPRLGNQKLIETWLKLYKSKLCFLQLKKSWLKPYKPRLETRELVNTWLKIEKKTQESVSSHLVEARLEPQRPTFGTPALIGIWLEEPYKAKLGFLQMADDWVNYYKPRLMMTLENLLLLAKDQETKTWYLIFDRSSNGASASKTWLRLY